MNFPGMAEILNVGPPPERGADHPKHSVTALTQPGNLGFTGKTVKCSLALTVGRSCPQFKLVIFLLFVLYRHKAVQYRYTMEAEQPHVQCVALIFGYMHGHCHLITLKCAEVSQSIFGPCWQRGRGCSMGISEFLPLLQSLP